ncbi:HD domain-containing phosphohydrolase [Arcobacter sp. YIC-464]|uniref:HD domain-containing phosphohydrolase n=1 Tax=Arcobacter sp. YIC-464 TaxID=3376631 RepID=UPI003C262740
MENKKILIVTNEEEQITLLSKYFKDTLYDFTIAKSVGIVLDMIIIQRISFDLILIDINLAEKNDFELTSYLKNSEKTKNIPIIYMSENNDNDIITKAFESGGQDLIIKPLNKVELLARVSTHIKLSHTLNQNIILLDQYKAVVDEGAIVSKTDKRGIITYVNKAFTEISGYKENELVGKPHNIVRDPNMPKEAFKDLWKTVKNKKVWKGEVSNLKKNGEVYIVKSTVMPILDDNGEVIEYISVRHDVSDIYKLQKEIEETQKEIVFTMGAISETRSKETGNHVKRVAEYSRVLAKYVGLEHKQIQLLVDASPMHDIGKVAIPDSILKKPSKLTDKEFEIMRTHAELGYKMMAHSNRPLLKTAAIIALEHHERWDGKGYPRHLARDEISIEGRITALADVFDALGSNRCYKEAWSDDKIFEFLKEQRAKQFDPQLIDIFFEHLDEFLEIRERLEDV